MVHRQCLRETIDQLEILNNLATKEAIIYVGQQLLVRPAFTATPTPTITLTPRPPTRTSRRQPLPPDPTGRNGNTDANPHPNDLNVFCKGGAALAGFGTGDPVRSGAYLGAGKPPACQSPYQGHRTARTLKTNKIESPRSISPGGFQYRFRS